MPEDAGGASERWQSDGAGAIVQLAIRHVVAGQDRETRTQLRAALAEDGAAKAALALWQRLHAQHPRDELLRRAGDVLTDAT